MGIGSSKRSKRRGNAQSGSATSHSSSRGNYSHPQQREYYYLPAPPCLYSQGSQTPQQPQRTLERKYSRIADNYRTLDEVTAALVQAGLESSNLIVGIDFTKSNEWTGARSFNRKSLHHIGSDLNPYEEAISIIGKTLSSFDEDNLIPCYGFGDASTHDKDVFSFYPEDRFCNGFEEALGRYREIVPQLHLAGPTSFAPIIEKAISIVDRSGGQYHVLLIIADGQVTRSVDTENGQLSPQEHKTIDAIVQASNYPLSIVLVGVGDGPWDTMRKFDDNIPARIFDNFQFVNFNGIMSNNIDPMKKQAEFALSALMEIPSQYKATLELGLLGHQRGFFRVALPPPIQNSPFSNNGIKISHSKSFQQRTDPYTPGYNKTVASAPPLSSHSDNQVCPNCVSSQKDMALNCGHQTCSGCGEVLQLCPVCQTAILIRIKLN